MAVKQSQKKKGKKRQKAGSDRLACLRVIYCVGSNYTANYMPVLDSLFWHWQLFGPSHLVVECLRNDGKAASRLTFKEEAERGRRGRARQRKKQRAEREENERRERERLHSHLSLFPIGRVTITFSPHMPHKSAENLVGVPFFFHF